MSSISGPGGRAVFSQGGGVEDSLKMFVEASVLTALFAGVGSLWKLRPLLALPEPKDKLLLSLSEGEVTGVMGLEARVTCKRAMQDVGVG